MQAVLDAKEAFEQANSGLNLDGVWDCTTSGGYKSTRTIKGNTGTAGSDQFTWTQMGNTIVFDFEGGHRVLLVTDPKDKDRLSAKKSNGEQIVWKRRR